MQPRRRLRDQQCHSAHIHSVSRWDSWGCCNETNAAQRDAKYIYISLCMSAKCISLPEDRNDLVTDRVCRRYSVPSSDVAQSLDSDVSHLVLIPASSTFYHPFRLFLFLLWRSCPAVFIFRLLLFGRSLHYAKNALWWNNNALWWSSTWRPTHDDYFSAKTSSITVSQKCTAIDEAATGLPSGCLCREPGRSHRRWCRWHWYSCKRCIIPWNHDI